MQYLHLLSEDFLAIGLAIDSISLCNDAISLSFFVERPGWQRGSRGMALKPGCVVLPCWSPLLAGQHQSLRSVLLV